MIKKITLQDSLLNNLCKEQASVAVFLQNGIKLQGVITAFDQDIIMLKARTEQMIYKHAISTIVMS